MSPLPKAFRPALIALLILRAPFLSHAGWFDMDSQKIVIVQGTSSLPDASEKPLAARLAKQFDTWLTEVGAPHKRLTDEEVTPWKLWRARVVILPYNPHPSEQSLKAFQSVIDSGGILVVCYGVDPALAALMEVRLGSYQMAKSKSQWASFEFDELVLPDSPKRVFQSSQHLIPAYPNSGTARVIAYWCDVRGTRTPDAAWVQSRAGFWMTHILRPGDPENKRQMLLAILATVLPNVWRQATDLALSPRRPFGEFDSLKSACQALSHPLPPATQSGTSHDAYLAAQLWQSDLTRLYTRRNLTHPFTLRGVWLNAETCPSPEFWPALESALLRQNLNTVFIPVGNPLTVRPATQLFPASSVAARQSQTQTAPAIHAWLSCMNLEGTAPEPLKTLRDQNRLQVSDTGEQLNWLCPSHPENRTLLIETVTSLAREGVYSGIHLDYIRYLNSSTCYCMGCRQRFEQALGRPIHSWPEAARSGSLKEAYQVWRADQISGCVTLMSKAIHSVNPDLALSAAVYGGTPGCFASVGQDWPEWLRRETVQFVCPMNYKPDLASFQSLLNTQKALNHSSRIFPGVGIASSQSQLSPDQTAAQLIRIQNAGFPGFVLFEYNLELLTTQPPFLPEKIKDLK